MRDRHEPGRLERGNITIHATDAEAWTAISTDVVRKAEAGATVVVTSNDAATQLNSLAQDARARAGHTRTPAVEVAGSDGLNIRVGDRIMTRSNDKDLRVVNRDTWTVARVHRDGSVTVKEHGRKARLPAEYVEAHTHLAYASTEYGVQGATVDFAHDIVTDSSSAQAVYVSATRGREHNTLHLVAGDVDVAEARSIFTGALRRESGDRGVEAACENISRDLHGIVLPAPGVDLKLRDELATASWEKRPPGISDTDPAAGIAALEQEYRSALEGVSSAEHERVGAHERASIATWERDYAMVEQVRVNATEATFFRRCTAEEAYERARRQFISKHGNEPAPQPSEQLRETWRREAIAPGCDERLGAARRSVQDTI
ncbi:hypothetical protein [Microbacterium sp. K27]|uniref:hypothetical protein n=1 Tax=Microbacterium sp. K27 TaxID=2305445 RepID=UPI001F1182AA|nr:hypothetical protein [Microbacterium sp. K27]